MVKMPDKSMASDARDRALSNCRLDLKTNLSAQANDAGRAQVQLPTEHISKQLLPSHTSSRQRENQTMLAVPCPMQRRCRSHSAPNLYPLTADELAIVNIFPDLNPRNLRIQEIRSWRAAWMDRSSSANRGPSIIQKVNRVDRKLVSRTNSLDDPLQELSDELQAIQKGIQMNGDPIKRLTSSPQKRPQLRLRLENMPTSQQAENRAQRAANRLISKREALDKIKVEGNAADCSASTAQQALMIMNVLSFSSGDESELASPADSMGRKSAYSPNHGIFTTENVAISEAGISSPDSTCLHLQENLERVIEIGRGASGVVYKAIHVPTLKVVAVKEVPVYGRGQRKQMVRELHALHSNLVPIIENDEELVMDLCKSERSRPTAASPYIVSFYDAYVDRPKNCIGLVMEYMGAGSLQDIVLCGGCQNEKILARLASGILHGLSHIHGKRMVHRDVKPHNLLTNRRGEAKISDFGLATTLNDNATQTKTFVGTLLYMAPERIGGGDYSYPADIWSFGLALLSVALGRYPLPTQDGFFGLVDSVANEAALQLPKDQFSHEICDFVHQCLKINPDERPTADMLLAHPFLHQYTPQETLIEWTRFVDMQKLCENRESEVDSLAEVVYRHIYERCVPFPYQPQSEYSNFLRGQRSSSHFNSNRGVAIPSVEKSLQIGLANYLGLSVEYVYQVFESKRLHFGERLMLDFCYSPKSWATPSVENHSKLSKIPDVAPHQHLRSTCIGRNHLRSSNTFWQKLQARFTKLGRNSKKKGQNHE